ncbi:Hypothetical predicted protein [Mytilus galloprovincialis]|uniref:Peptidase M12B domain-containing protein n=1 Tax=Mytilus galloprovincialis TaxID=29158 RepID=A0A8B6HS01_MYTGA|nr:Hypothetical predicted protein [Mytilus galloprovincialis]
MHKFEIIKQKNKPLLFDDGQMTGGLAYVGGICGESAQSIIEDDFDYDIVITTSHELGHSLSSQHDGKGNNCHESDGYVMAAARKVHLGTTATHPWIFSNCSTNYFTSKLDSLDSQNKNCMKTLGPNIDPTALAKYNKLYGGQAFDADVQCKLTHGNSSSVCKSLFKGNYTTICDRMYCKDPTDSSKCIPSKAWDRTVCGNKKWCVYGVCTNDVNAPVSNAGQLYDPDTQCKHIYGHSSDLCRGIYKGNLTYICGKLYCRDPANPKSCHQAVAEEGTQCGNKKWCVDGACTFDTKAPESNAGQLYDPDTQCRHIYGNSSELSRWSYKGDFTSICGALNCKNPKDPTSYIQTEAAEERTQCGNKKWCVDGACTFDSKAIRHCNGWSCAKMVQVAPNNCPAVPIKCCASCAPPTTTTPLSTSQSPTTTTFSTTTTTPSTSKIPTTT